MSEELNCGECLTTHAEVVPMNSDGTCLCCLAKHSPMCFCGKPGEVTVDPFDWEINNDATLRILCEDCWRERSYDV